MAELETLASGFGLLEGPRCDERNRLYFSDVPNGGVYRRSPDGNIETLIPKRRGVGGIALNEGGGIVCTGRGLIYWNEASRTSRDLFVEWEGRKLNGLNDLQPDDHGSIFVGSLEHNALEEGAKRIPGSLFRVDPDGSVTKLYEGIETTNGMGFSPRSQIPLSCRFDHQGRLGLRRSTGSHSQGPPDLRPDAAGMARRPGDRRRGRRGGRDRELWRGRALQT